MSFAWYDAAVTAEVGGSDTLTFAYTVTAGADYLVVRTASQADPARQVASVTFNGDALFPIVQQDDLIDINSVAIFARRAPDIATGNVVVVWDGSVSGTATAKSASGVKQTSDGASYRTPVSANDSGASVNATSVAGDMVVDVIGTSSGSLVVGAGQSADAITSPGISFRYGCSYESAVGISTTMSWTGGSVSWALAAVALIPADAPDLSVPTLFYSRSNKRLKPPR